MKLRGRLLMMALLPVIGLGILSYGVVSVQITKGIEEQTYRGMKATTLAVREIFESGASGEYHLDESGQLWKGDEMNISGSQAIVDSIKADTGFDIGIFYGDESILTTIAGGKGAKAPEKAKTLVLGSGQEYGDDDTAFLGKRYISYYAPIFQTGTSAPVGMFFLGEEYADVAQVIKSSMRSMMVIMICVLALVVLTSILSANRIAGAIKGAIAYVTQMSQGRLGIQASGRLLSRGDEIGDMCRGVKSLDDNLSAVVAEIQAQTDVLGEVSNACGQDAHKALESAEQVNAASEEVAAATTSQAQGTLEAENSVNLMGQTIEETNGQVQGLSDTAKEVAMAAESARKTLAELNQSMKQVKKAVDDVHHQTNETHFSVEKISDMTKMITSIASQTNMLSLNASIEAARAGEMGKGFAVVAEEIRKLAEQSNTSAVEIQEVLGQLKNNSDISVSTMEQVQEIIQVQAEKLVQTNHAFETVGSGIEQSVQGIGKIMEEMSSLNGARSHTVAEVQNVASLAQQNAASIEETAASIDEVAHLISAMAGRMDNLRQASDTLKEKASVFQL